MDAIRIDKFKQLITSRTGLYIRRAESEKFVNILSGRMRSLKLDQDPYYELLNTLSAAGEQEWHVLASLLTTGESYFFRDEGQFTLLKNRLLPELIEQNRSCRTLRLLSAGCSTGEEPYSLAIIVDQLLSDKQDWDIAILGVDINQQALARARRGVFGTWSFRSLKPDLRNRYFHETRDGWALDANIRSRVTFHHLNLWQAKFPDCESNICDLDLILCRNVFIYFDRDAITPVVSKFAASLREGGYLITGHAELGDTYSEHLQRKVFPDSVVYQRGNAKSAKTHPIIIPVVKAASSSNWSLKPALTASSRQKIKNHNVSVPQMKQELRVPLATKDAPSPAGTGLKDDHSELAKAQVLFSQCAYQDVVATLESLVQREPRNVAAIYLTAKALANLGSYDQAAFICQQAIEIDNLAVNPIYLLSQIRELQGDREQSKDLLRKVIYISPEFIAAYLDLADLLERENDHTHAQRMRQVAFDLLQTLPSQSSEDPYKTFEGEELIHAVSRSIDS